MRKFLFPLSLLFGLLLSSCNFDHPKADIIVTVFAHYDLTRSLTQGTNLTVAFPITPGQDVHAWQPSPRDIQSFYDASLVVMNGLGLEPWSDNLLTQNEFSADVLILSEFVELLEDDHDHDHNDALMFSPFQIEEEHAYDPHFWLDPHNAQFVVTAIESKIIELFPQSASIVSENAIALRNELAELEEAFSDLFEDNHHEEIDTEEHGHTTFVFAGHNAFGYWSNYGLEFITPYEGFSPSTSPTASQIATLNETLSTMENPIIYASLLEGLSIANLLKDQFANLEIYYLSTIENVKADELETATYIDLMRFNLAQLVLGIHHD